MRELERPLRAAATTRKPPGASGRDDTQLRPMLFGLEDRITRLEQSLVELPALAFAISDSGG